MQRAIEFEIERHVAGSLRAAAPLVQETRLWDPATGRTTVDADQGGGGRLPLLPRAGPAAARRSTPRWIEEVRRALPELPEARRRRFVAQYHLPEYDAGVLTQSMALADYFERVAAGVRQPEGGEQLGHGRR